MGGMFAGAFIMAGVPLMIYDKVNGNDVLNGKRFTIIAGVCSILAFICYILCYSLTTERVRTEASADAMRQNSVGNMLKTHLKTERLFQL